MWGLVQHELEGLGCWLESPGCFGMFGGMLAEEGLAYKRECVTPA